MVLCVACFLYVIAWEKFLLKRLRLLTVFIDKTPIYTGEMKLKRNAGDEPPVVTTFVSVSVLFSPSMCLDDTYFILLTVPRRYF